MRNKLLDSGAYPRKTTLHAINPMLLSQPTLKAMKNTTTGFFTSVRAIEITSLLGGEIVVIHPAIFPNHKIGENPYV